ncbi:hypothetical protein FQN57_000287 [Myotisia sp. PD_48]|nr:hypothetical protein FQN57_000287 [Myotisia sp. PD_48]
MEHESCRILPAKVEELLLQPMDRADEDTRQASSPLLNNRRQSSSSLPGSYLGAEDEGRIERVDSKLTKGTGTWFIWALTFSAGISGLLFGYDTGVISSTLVSIGTDLSRRELTILDKSLITSSTSLFALLASPLAGILADKWGRKPVIIFADIFFILGSLWQSVSSTVWEMTPRWLVSADRTSEARTVMLRVYGPSQATTQLVEQIIKDINHDINEETAMISTQYSHVGRPDLLRGKFIKLQSTFADLFFVGYNRRALTIACMLQGFQQLCGFNSLMYFAASIFQLLSFSSPTLTSLSVAVTNFLFTFLAFSLIDRIGRRRILLCSVPIMILALLSCAFAFSLFDIPSTSRNPSTNAIRFGPNNNAHANGDSGTVSRAVPITILVSLTIYTASYASGLGNVPWQQSELFPLRVRSVGSALATATNWGSNFIVGLTFLPMMEWLSGGWTFFIYAVVCAVGWVCIWMIYPEMSGLGLEDVRSLLAEGWGVDESLHRFSARQSSHLDRHRS